MASSASSDDDGLAGSPSSGSSRATSPSPRSNLRVRPRGGASRDARKTTRRELKHAIEKKFRQRYASLQQAYEQRLEALVARVGEAVSEVQQDATIHCLQENALTSEYASARLGEIVHECFHGEREQYLKAMSDQVAWQASDLRENQQKLRVVQRREAEAQKQWKLAQRDIQALHRQLDVRVEELKESKRREAERAAKYHALQEERDRTRAEVDALKQTAKALETLQKEHEALKQRLQSESDQASARQSELAQGVKELQDVKNKLELEKQASEQEAAHLKHLLSLSESKSQAVAQSLQQLQSEDYAAKLARAESELAHQRQMSALAEKEHEELEKRYEEFGQQVEQYMAEQTQEKAAVLAKGEAQTKQLQTQLESVERRAQDALKTKQNEILRTSDQLKFHQEALGKAEKKISTLEERCVALEAQQADAKLRHEKQVGSLERELAQWRNALEREQEKAKSQQKLLADTKERYETKLASLQDALSRQARQGAHEKEVEARTRWQNEFVAKQEARIEALKAKYDAALETQQAELLHARQLAIDTATAATEKWEKTKAAHKEEQELERRLRAETAARDKERKDEQKALQFAQKQMKQEFAEREKRLLEREQALTKKEKREERRRSEEAQKSAAAADSAKPSVVVVNVNGADDEDDEDQRTGGRSLARRGGRFPNRERNGNQSEDDDSVPRAQHVAELQAKEAQVALQAEEKAQKLMKEFQERKESEFRAAMVNVRKGIQKLELSLEEAKTDKKRAEEQLLSERQAFVNLKHECEDAKETKRTIVQRLEEANENLGRLRAVVRESQTKCHALEEKCSHAGQAKEASDAALADSQKMTEELREQVTRLTEAAAHLETSLDASVETSEQSKKELLDQVAVLEHKLQAREEQFIADMAALEERKSQEIRHASSEHDVKLRELQSVVDEARRQQQEAETETKSLELSVRELTASKDALQEVVSRLKADSSRQKKEFADLSRMHKNLADSVSTRVDAANDVLEEERSKRVAAEMRVLKAEKQTELVSATKEKELRACRFRLKQLAQEWGELRKGVTSEMNVGWVQLEKELALAGMEWRKQTENFLQQATATWQRKTKEDKQEWKRRMAQKDKEMDALLSNQRVNDQAKYDQVAGRLEEKSRELESLEARLSAQADVNGELQQTIRKLEDELKLHVMEQSHLQDRLTGSEAASQREAEKKRAVRALLEKRKAICHELRGFVLSLAGSIGVELQRDLLDDDDGKSVDMTWDRRELSTALSQLSTRLQENQDRAIQKAVELASSDAKVGASAPLVSELEAAKKALRSLWANPASDDSEYDGHLPWYARASRTLKRERESSEQTAVALQEKLAAKETEKQQMLHATVQWQEANNLLRFEKDTALREMESLSQALQKRREQELQELRAEHDTRMEQLKQRHDRASMKADQDHETAMDQLRDLLEAERRATTHAKNAAIEQKIVLERAQEEFQEAQQKLEKELDELRDTAAKWKRKAKLGSKSPGTGGSSKAALRVSTSSHDTEEDSDASYRALYPSSRRASNAMADLSSLMEQSLVSIRKEALVPQFSPRRSRHGR